MLDHFVDEMAWQPTSNVGIKYYIEFGTHILKEIFHNNMGEFWRMTSSRNVVKTQAYITRKIAKRDKMKLTEEVKEPKQD